MPTARNNLEALLVNDPEHPAIREFILTTKSILDAADRTRNVKSDVAALLLIKSEMESLAKRLLV